MKEKGFTLMELLAVIVILALLALLTTTSVTKLVKDSKNDLNDIQLLSIKSAAEAWGAENLSKLPNSGECGYITLKNLIDDGFINISIINSETPSLITDELKIKITSFSNSSTDKLVVSYEIINEYDEVEDECNWYLMEE